LQKPRPCRAKNAGKDGANGYGTALAN